MLAINEALANAAEFAYLDFPGTMNLPAHHDPGNSSLTVTISDHGVWRTATYDAASRMRGRGIPLMKALSDRVAIETSRAGTQVCMTSAGGIELLTQKRRGQMDVGGSRVDVIVTHQRQNHRKVNPGLGQGSAKRMP